MTGLSTAVQMSALRGSALFRCGFRPFFLFAAAWGGFAMVWLLVLANEFDSAGRLNLRGAG